MANILEDTLETYKDNIRLVLLFSVPFIISFLIPFLAPLPTYITAGAIFVRSASMTMSINPIQLMAITIAMFFSLLFLSFAFVAISLIVKSKRTQTRHARTVLEGIEKYTGRVFVVLLICALVLAALDLAGYYANVPGIVVAVASFLFFIAIFYAPTAIVIDDKRIFASMRSSVRLVAKAPQYYLLCTVLVAGIVSLLDFMFIHAFGTFSSYLLLIVNSLLVLPYFVIFQAEAYMKRFPILRH